MGTVWLAEDERLGRRVAVKRLHGDISDDDLVRRFQREARLGASLNHPNVVTVYDIASDEEGVLIVMEYVEGHTLHDEIAGGGLDRDRALAILHGVAEALDHAHAQAVQHRDVKPANVLIRLDGAVKLADLGIATAAEQSRITLSGSVLGTAAYMAPERLEGRAGDAGADVYALASVAFEALSGRKAVEGATPLEVAQRVVSQPPPDLAAALPGAPPRAAAVLRRGLAKDPAERPGSAGALVDELAEAFEAAPTPTAPTIPRATGANSDEHRDAFHPKPGASPPAPRNLRERGDRFRRGPFLIAAVLALLIAAAVIALSTGGGDETKRTEAVTGESPPPEQQPSAGDGAPAAPATPAPAGEPTSVVSDFYERAASHDYAGAWALASERGQGQLGGLDSFSRGQSTLREISFPVLRTTRQTDSAATVELRSIAVHSTRTDRCSGTIDLVRSGSKWLLDGFNIATCRTSSGEAPQSAAGEEGGD